MEQVVRDQGQRTQRRAGGAAAGPADVSSVAFAQLAQRISAAAAAAGLVSPSFRSPPRVAGVHRTIRRRRDFTIVIAVARRGRSLPAVVADIIDGVLVANELDPAAASLARGLLWEAVAAEVGAHITAA